MEIIKSGLSFLETERWEEEHYNKEKQPLMPSSVNQSKKKKK